MRTSSGINLNIVQAEEIVLWFLYEYDDYWSIFRRSSALSGTSQWVETRKRFQHNLKYFFFIECTPYILIIT